MSYAHAAGPLKILCEHIPALNEGLGISGPVSAVPLRSAVPLIH